jgi:hypothetical protein
MLGEFAERSAHDRNGATLRGQRCSDGGAYQGAKFRVSGELAEERGGELDPFDLSGSVTFRVTVRCASTGRR